MGILKVFEGDGKTAQQDAVDLVEAIKGEIYEYSGKMPVVSVLGVLEIVKAEILAEASE